MEENEQYEHYRGVLKDQKLYGKCTLQIQFQNRAEYLKWKKYIGGDERWDFLTSYPAIMQRECSFETTLDLDAITYRIVQLLQMGFNVRAVNWRLNEFKSQTEQGL